MEITKQFEMKNGRWYLRKKKICTFISISMSFVCIFMILLMFIHAEEPDNN